MFRLKLGIEIQVISAKLYILVFGLLKVSQFMTIAFVYQNLRMSKTDRFHQLVQMGVKNLINPSMVHFQANCQMYLTSLKVMKIIMKMQAKKQRLQM